MANEINKKDGWVQKCVKVPLNVEAAIQRALEDGVARGLMPSEADIMRKVIVEGLKAIGFPVEKAA